MRNLADLVWIEWRKAIRSGMPLWTALGAAMMPLGIAFLLFVSRNPDVSQKLGLVGAKANLVAYAATDWPAYVSIFGQLVAAGGFIVFVLVVSWVFGREFADGTVKDLLAVPVARSSILLAKFVIVAVWSAALTVVIVGAGLVMGALLQLPGGSTSVILQGGQVVAVAATLAIVLVLPFAFLASAGRGYLLPIGIAVLTLMFTNLAIVLERGEYFPWAIGLLYAQGKTPLTATSYLIVVLTGMAGMVATYLWWKLADQNR